MLQKDTNIENKMQDESFAKFVLSDMTKANKRKDFIFLTIIILLICFCFYKEVKYQELLSSLTFEETVSYTADTGTGDGNAIINDNGSEVNINGKSNEKGNS